MMYKIHGGKRKGAGRPATGKKETIVVRIDSRLLQAVNDLKSGVITNQADGLSTELEHERREHDKLKKVVQGLKETMAKLEKKPMNSSPHNYDGNAKEFRAEVGRVMGMPTTNRSKFASKLKIAYTAVGITPHKNGWLSCDADRLAVYDWLRNKHNC